ncbi:hypothetical protein GCM10007383_35570 [Arenibacter certesii]|uniref:alpha-L-fucosidase n=2 Tax=Arenibacter certesii TaxID=228955 RepID=A0A918J783_9FLAO|nr:hypothetical protein GCM10007383_35570 [Arenibacter certesii]
MEYFSLVCYGLNTYTEQEWAYGDVDPKLFDPSNLDTDQWAHVASEAGMKGLILVAKHHDGFCLWPSRYTDYSVAATPWKDGKGDVLADLSKSCKKYGLKLGVYLSPWDRNHADYGKPEYVDYYYNQLEELMTGYGDIFEFWIDGANGGTGYYGGAKENRSIDRTTYYGYDSIFSIVKKHQPNAVIFSDVGPGVRWVGNESGIASETNWNTINANGRYPGDPDPEFGKKLGTGDKNGPQWIPAEANTTLSWPKAWYYHTGKRPRSLNNLVELYYTSIGRGSPLDLGLAIAPSGQIREEDKNALLNFKKRMDLEFAVNLVENARITASDYREGHKEYSPVNAIDNDLKSFWATNDSVNTASLTIDFGKLTTFNRLLLQEAISLGQRVHEFKVEIDDKGSYKEIAKGTTIGYKRILRLDNIKTNRLRITFETDAPCLTLSNLAIYDAPALVDDPIARMDNDGKLFFEHIEGINTYYSIGERTEKSNFSQYSEPINLSNGGQVYYYAKEEKTGFETDIVMERFGLSRNKWEVITQEGKREENALRAIDNNPDSFFIIENKAEQQEIIIDMGTTKFLNAFGYLPRQDGKKEGVIFEYEFYVSKDHNYWQSPVAKGSFQNIENNPVRQIIPFKEAKEGRYIKLVSKSTIKNDGKVSYAEIEVF